MARNFDFSLTAEAKDGVKTLHGRLPACSPTEAQQKAIAVGRDQWRKQITDGTIKQFTLDGIKEVTP